MDLELNRNSKETIETTPVVVSKDKEHSGTLRKNIIITNTSTAGQNITLAINSEAVNKEGIYLAVGGSWSDNAESGYMPTQKMITAISDAADGTLSIHERLN